MQKYPIPPGNGTDPTGIFSEHCFIILCLKSMTSQLPFGSTFHGKEKFLKSKEVLKKAPKILGGMAKAYRSQLKELPGAKTGLG